MTDYNSNATVLVVNATVGPVFLRCQFLDSGFCLAERHRVGNKLKGPLTQLGLLTPSLGTNSMDVQYSGCYYGGDSRGGGVDQEFSKRGQS